ncbi:MAG TPA: T9SS type A sorting domain-containing protein [Chitinophagaceae bacterium]|nr:T9SS type A sorting domain-containing protein [Chitinophagaceae bacterium]
MKKLILSSALLFLVAASSQAEPNVGAKKRNASLHKTAAGCNQTTAVIDLDVNNVRAHLMNGGDMWWDRPTGNASYEVPKGSNKNSLFAGSIWIGGKDVAAGNAIRVAAQTYRQSGNDYWSGPLDPGTGSVDFQTCADWDRFWKINASDISKFRGFYSGLDPINDSVAVRDKISLAAVPDIIKEWPARGNKEIRTATGGVMPVYNQDLAEFVDVNPFDGDDYNWRHGDYPKISGDQYIWWIFNDKGDAKTETTSESMNLEIRAAAFAFATNDCLNEATFYNYKIQSLSAFDLADTYMATWCDADLGYAFDDFVGCDTARGLGILYNGDSYDDGVAGYGYEIPMVGVDYFQGPTYFNTTTLKDTELKMTVFTYYNNTFEPDGNPEALDDYYQYITGFWKDGQPFTTACTARGTGDTTKFIFYGDPCKGGWTEVSCGNTPSDRRFIHSSGPFPLKQGAAASNITIGAVWVPNVGGGKSACFSKIQVCDDKAQDLFNNNFKLPFGPQAPAVAVQPLDRKLVFDLDNLSRSNNYAEGYGTNFSDKKFIEISKKAYYIGSPDSVYKFEGYLVYQLKNSSVALSDIRSKDGSINTDKARLVFQCDKKNGIKQLVNFEQSTDINQTYFVPKLMVDGADKGIQHSFALTQDAFATGTSKGLVNYKYYYYVVVAYAYNNFADFDAKKTDSTQDRQYLESRTDGNEQPIKVIKAMPHPANDSLYIQTYADYGTGLQLTRIEGVGNNGNALELTEATEEQTLNSPYRSLHPTYKSGAGPMNMMVVNPDSIKAGDYEVWFKVDSFNTTTSGEIFNGAYGPKTTWFVKRVDNGANDTVYNEAPINEYSEKYLRKYKAFDWGISGGAAQQIRPGDSPKSNENGLITSSVTFDDINNPWLSGIADEDGESFNNWIRAGVDFQGKIPSQPTCEIKDFDNSYDFPPLGGDTPIINNVDQLGTFEKVVNGTFAPYNLVTNLNLDECGWGLMYGTGDRTVNRLQNVYSVDIVFTSDRSKWSRCPVIEMTDHSGALISEGGAYKYNIRKHLGWNGDTDGNGNPVYSTNAADSGMSYFPGYAIDVETGRRLAICFGEESANIYDRGNDMLWNPTSRVVDEISFASRWAGKHIIYVSRLRYDSTDYITSRLRVNSNSNSKPELREAYKSMMWVGVPRLRSGYNFTSAAKGLIPNTARVRIRVTRPYARFIPDSDTNAMRNGGWPLYSFSTRDIAPAKIGDGRNVYTDNKDEVLKQIFVVPNPYYAYSEYEENRLENKVRIVNLPEKATIKIFTADGVLVKTIKKSDYKTNFVDWDIKNEKGIPVSSGMYLVHVNLDGIGETVLKWFGAMRPLDITSF